MKFLTQWYRSYCRWVDILIVVIVNDIGFSLTPLPRRERKTGGGGRGKKPVGLGWQIAGEGIDSSDGEFTDDE